jgi:serine/threonine protein phosphatase 1
MKTFVIGDIHGAYKALIQCFERSEFDYKKDRLIVLGDVCDGYPEVKQCVDELLKIKHCDYILGNHDKWALDWALTGWRGEIWQSQGGYNTIASYGDQPMPQAHMKFLNNSNYWIELEGKIFVHGGFNPNNPIASQDKKVLLWDRDLLHAAYKKYLSGQDYKFSDYDEIYVGHTTTETYRSVVPLHFCNVWALDTGAGWSGKLTMMDIKSKEFWQSDLTKDLYGLPAR